jgi:hypothetical protein
MQKDRKYDRDQTESPTESERLEDPASNTRPANINAGNVSGGKHEGEANSEKSPRNVSWGKQEVFHDYDKSQTTRTTGTAEGIQQHLRGVTSVSPIEERLLYGSATKPRSVGKIAVDDVFHRSPMDADAESNILRSLEERDHSHADSPRDSLASHVSDDEIAFLAKKSNDDTKSRAGRFASVRRTAVPSRVRPDYNRTKSVQQKLAGLSDAIEAFQHKEVRRARLERFGEDPELNLPSSAADKFHQNASILLTHRKKKNDAAGIGAGAGTGTSSNEFPSDAHGKSFSHWKALRTAVKNNDATGIGAGAGSDTFSNEFPSVEFPSERSSKKFSRWNALRTAVKINAHAKKNDDGIIFEGGPGTEDEEDGRNSGHAVFDEAIGGNEDFGKEQGSGNEAVKTEETYKLFSSDELGDFFGPGRTPILLFCKFVSVYVLVPVIGIAAILFHLAGNPPTGILTNGGRPINGTLMNEDGAVVDPGIASASWWVSGSHISGRLDIQSAVLSDPY